MKRSLRFGILSSLCLSSAILSHAQERFAYAITDASKEGVNWSVLRRLDMGTGQYSDVLFKGMEANTTVYDASTKKVLNMQPDAKYGTALQAPFSSGVAAAAFDPLHNRLYFTPMFIDQLRYIDLKTMQVYYVTDQPFTTKGNFHNDESKCVTRMVITPDGDGYAITNDATTFIKFSTGKKPKITQLGSLVDDPANKGISIHNRCTSFGGDMVADDKGNLYVFSASNHVFMVSTETKVATHLGTVKGLPGTFTTNGAAVNQDGNIVVCSAVDGNANYVVSPKDWSATVLSKGGAFHSSDLANSNYLSTNRNKPTIETIKPTKSDLSNNIQVYPNPVVNNQFNIEFSKVPAGDYTLQITDAMGKVMVQRRVAVSMDSQIQPMSMARTSAKGFYLVRVLDNNQKSVYEQKLLVQ